MFNVIEEYGKPVELVIMDLILKRENGFDLIRRLKMTDKYRDIPVLVLTEHADKANVVQAKELGVCGYLRKPIRKEELVERVTKLLDT
jgi:two-component system, chemotaxis family, chemotaxis protein CheY